MQEIDPQNSVKATAVHPSGKISDLPLKQSDQSIVDVFDTQVRHNASRIAIKTDKSELTYHDLNNMANCVAHAVRNKVSAGPVVVLIELGSTAIASILGVLKAGFPYVHIDPMFPQSSSSTRLAELGTTLVLSDATSLKHRESAGPLECNVVHVDYLDFTRAWPNPDVTLDPDALAQIINTSGSTGSPKAVCHVHRSVINGVRGMANNYHLCNEDRLLLVATGTGQASAVIFSALLNGAALFPFNVRKEGMSALVSWIINEKITIYRSSATLFRQFAKALTGAEEFPNVRLVRLASETAHKSDVEIWRRHFSKNCILVSGLSTAECGPIAEYFMNKHTVLNTETVPVGFPVGNAQPMVVDKDGIEVPRGEIGEIVVKSDSLAMGYLNRPKLTAEVFQTVDGEENLRLFKTRDLGRMSADGLLEHLGRKDFRLKIRGYSVSLSQVEETLISLKEIQSAVVVPLTGGDHSRLIAYVSPSPDSLPTVSALRKSTAELLPEYMVPSAFIILSEIPVGSGGKVDRQALPDPGRVRPELDVEHVPPQTSTQERLIELWTDVLGIDHIGIHDPFLELGGDSLLAMQLSMNIDRQFDVQVPQWRLYECATPSDMSLLIDEYLLRHAATNDMEQLLNHVEQLSQAQVQELLTALDEQPSDDAK
jgi:acyl-CoA synthetase (AMP-forming)/AMP-acid ligase II/acyl carrier protein